MYIAVSYFMIIMQTASVMRGPICEEKPLQNICLRQVIIGNYNKILFLLWVSCNFRIESQMQFCHNTSFCHDQKQNIVKANIKKSSYWQNLTDGLDTAKIGIRKVIEHFENYIYTPKIRDQCDHCMMNAKQEGEMYCAWEIK